MSAGLAYADKLRATGSVSASVGFLFSKSAVSLGVCNNSLAALDRRLKESLTLQVISAAYIELGKSLAALQDNTLKTRIYYLCVVYVYVSDSVIEVVSNSENAVIEEYVKHLFVHALCRKITDGLALPIRVDLLESLDRLGRDIEGVSLTRCDRVVFLFEPFE